MNNLWWVLAAAAVLSVPLGGCRHAQRDLLPVGTCVRDETGRTTVVACGEAHMYKVIAIAPRPEACPAETSMFASPADPAEGTVTECFQAHTATK